MTPKEYGHMWVDTFRKYNPSGVWLNAQARVVADELDARIDNPELINQNNTDYCGFAAMAYKAASNAPQDYAWFVIRLFEVGNGPFAISPGRKLEMKASSDLRKARIPFFADDGAGRKVMPQADFISLSTIRENVTGTFWNIGMDIPIIGPLVRLIHGGDGATAGEVVDALKKAGCSASYDQTTLLSHQSLGNLKAASDHAKNGRIVILSINADLLTEKNTTPTGTISRGNHWVVLPDPVNFAPGDRYLAARIFSWGKYIDIPFEGGGNMFSTDLFLSRYHGYVVGYL